MLRDFWKWGFRTSRRPYANPLFALVEFYEWEIEVEAYQRKNRIVTEVWSVLDCEKEFRDAYLGDMVESIASESNVPQM